MSGEDERQRRQEEYREKLKSPEWRAKRIEIFQRDDWTCQNCGYYAGELAKFLQVHHHWYNQSKDPWDYPNEALITLCRLCHEAETSWRAEMERDLLDTLKRKGFLGSDIANLSARIEKEGVQREAKPRLGLFDGERMDERNRIREQRGLPPMGPDGTVWDDYNENLWIEPE